MEQSFTFKQLWLIIRGRIVHLISFSILLSIICWTAGSFFISPVYEATRQIVVNNNNSNNSQMISNLQYANTYSDIILSEVVLQKVAENLKIHTTYEKFYKQIDVTNNKDSQVITISVNDTDYNRAVKIANEIAVVFKEQVMEIMKLDNIELFPPTEAVSNPVPIQPKPILFGIVGMIAGAIIGCCVLLLIEFFNGKVQNEIDIEEILHVPVLGTITKIKKEKGKRKHLNAERKPLIKLKESQLGGRQIER